MFRFALLVSATSAFLIASIENSVGQAFVEKLRTIRRHRLLYMIVLDLFLSVSSVSLGNNYTFNRVDFPDEFGTTLYGINNAGKIVGFHGRSAFLGGVPGSFAFFNHPKGDWTNLIGMNNYGTLIGHDLIEGDETVTLTLSSSPSYQIGFQNTATVTITHTN